MKMQYRVFNTGDQIWVSERFGQRVTVKLLTHDGWSWEEGEGPMRRLTGVERYAHIITVFFMKGILKVLSA